MPLTMHFEPIIRQYLAAGHRLADTVDEDFTPTTGK